MLRHNCLAAIIIAMVFSLPGIAEEYSAPNVVGTAYDRTSGIFLYTERHFCSADRLSCKVEYRDSFGAMIAEKKLDYRLSLIGPALEIKDYRQALELSVPASEREELVIDAGFDNFVRSRWDELISGNSVQFPFLGVGFDKPINMRAIREKPANCDDDKVCLSIGLNSWLLGMLVDPIKLSYSRESRELLWFSGISNIVGESGETLSVDIHYQYESDILLVGPLDYQSPQELNL